MVAKIQDLVLHFFSLHPTSPILEASHALNLSRQQIYSARYRIGLTKKIRRVQKLLYRKIIKAVLYCPSFSAHKGSKTNSYALTYEANKKDRSTELIAAIESHKEFKKCHNSQQRWGYDDQRKSKSDSTPVYPKIEVGEE